ncbi:bifunctional methylenetetrahydrofolate dehydrogenase/methenyltetrahydrofolate cyclohydrolase FolD [Alphaproteobacteria bacterium]|nr:bifunctional methylenetetrahydrofolate dehydrogenase/methenyltetrahydrofolate cyclohydrolase FolD [Alphaproteobacteria bacterium]
MELPKIINGKFIASEVLEKIKIQVHDVKKYNNFTPGLAVILIGDDPASSVYVRNKEKTSLSAGMNSWVYKYPSEVKEKEIIDKINNLNKNDEVDGILVQLPFPKNSILSERKIINFIDPLKDVDGLHTTNIGKLANGEDGLFPATPSGCMILIKKFYDKLDGKKAVIVGRSNLVGKPIAAMLLRENCTVTILHSKTKNIKNECKNADILIAAIGKPNFIKGDWIKEDSIVIDVGINRIIKENKNALTGDVDFDAAKKYVKAITPVPGGVGPMTIACLLINTFKAAHLRRNLTEPSINF